MSDELAGDGPGYVIVVERRSDGHCPTCICGRRAPVQAQCRDGNRRDGRRGPGTIAWSEHLRAWSAYVAQTHSQQSAERIAERGGFGFYELAQFLGHEPATWEPR